MDIQLVVDLFTSQNRLQETTSILLDYLKPNLPEHAALQTKLLELNLMHNAQVAEALPGVPTKAVGMRDVPGIGQSELLEEHSVLSPERIEQAARAVLASAVSTGSTAAAGWSWVPGRYVTG